MLPVATSSELSNFGYLSCFEFDLVVLPILTLLDKLPSIKTPFCNASVQRRVTGSTFRPEYPHTLGQLHKDDQSLQCQLSPERLPKHEFVMLIQIHRNDQNAFLPHRSHRLSQKCIEHRKPHWRQHG
jgi:hypothetical protein